MATEANSSMFDDTILDINDNDNVGRGLASYEHLFFTSMRGGIP